MSRKPLTFELSPYEELFETYESRMDRKRERLFEIPLSDIQNFPDHPYKVTDDSKMDELVFSIKEYGLFQPILVRQIGDDKYEIVSGHRRKRAFELAGIEKIPCRVREMSFEEATITMVESNTYREKILPSEKAKAYKMRLDAMKKQAGRPSKENCRPVGENLNTKRSGEILGEQVGESERQIQRYIRLNNLIPELLNLVDEEKIKLRPAVEISYLTEEEQTDLFDAIEATDATPSHAQAIVLRSLSFDGMLDNEKINEIMSEPKPNQKEKLKIPFERIPTDGMKNYVGNGKKFPSTEDFIVTATEFYLKHLNRQRNRDAR